MHKLCISRPPLGDDYVKKTPKKKTPHLLYIDHHGSMEPISLQSESVVGGGRPQTHSRNRGGGKRTSRLDTFFPPSEKYLKIKTQPPFSSSEKRIPELLVQSLRGHV